MNDFTDFTSIFLDKRLRNLFVRNMYAVLTVMNGLSFCVTLLFLYKSVLVIVYLSLCCCCRELVRRLQPWNCLLLLIMYGSLGTVSACVVQTYDELKIVLLSTVLYTLAAVLFVTLSIVLFPCKRFLFKYLLCVMWTTVVVTWSMTYMTLAITMRSQLRPEQLKMGFVIALIYTAYLAISTEHITTSPVEELTPEDFWFGAIILAVDIMNVFLCMFPILDVTD